MRHHSRSDASRLAQHDASDREGLDIGARGRYREPQLGGISDERLARYFDRSDGAFAVSAPLRKCVMFAHHDVTRDAPFTRLDLVSCRNLFIYLNHELQARVLGAFHFAMKPGSTLAHGSSETLGDQSDRFVPIDPARKLFRSIGERRATAWVCNDLDRLLAATDVGTLVVDREQIIRRFTPSVSEFLPILERDVGRPITHLANSLGGAGFLEEVAHVIETGHTSLETLVIVEPQILKIDAACIRGVDSDDERRRRLRRLVQVARSLGATIVAQGVENEAEVRVVDDLDIEWCQGFYFAEPVVLG